MAVRHLYVIELDEAVLNDNMFAAANENRDPSKPCVYVGLTGVTPEERFENHKRGYKASYYPKTYGTRLIPELGVTLDSSMPYEEALSKEVELASKLRSEGYAVWQN